MGTQNYRKAAKAKVVLSLPAIGNAEVGELYYDATNNRLYIRLISGWKYISTDGQEVIKITVTKTVSTNSKYISYHGANATEATAIEEVIDALDEDQVPMNQVRFSTAHDGTTFYVTALVRRG